MHILVIFLFFQGGEIVELNQYFIHGVVFQKSRKEVSTGLLLLHSRYITLEKKCFCDLLAES
jgi:hypothetical protein